MATNTDPRFAQKRFEGAEKPRRYADEGRIGGATAASRRVHAVSDEKYQYHHPVRAMEASRARVEK